MSDEDAGIEAFWEAHGIRRMTPPTKEERVRWAHAVVRLMQGVERLRSNIYNSDEVEAAWKEIDKAMEALERHGEDP